jgi:asparagine synthase (glutamine-hydrolysing)
MQARSGRPVKSFAISFDEKRYHETTYARAVANHLGTEHTEATVSAHDALALIPQLPFWFDEPIAIRSQIPAMILSRLARREVTVALSGDGGDELFGGYPGYFIARAVHRATGSLPPRLRRLTADGADLLVGGIAAVYGILPAARRQGLWPNRVRQISSVARDGGGISELYGQLYSSVAARLPLTCIADEHPMRWQDAQHRAKIEDPIDRMGYFALLGTMVDGTLAKWDRASMAYSLEVRVPFLDHRVVEFAWRLPPALKYNKQGGSKRLLRRLLYRHLPRELADRPKKGFSSPLPMWLRGPLRPWAKELLDQCQLREEGNFEPKVVRECWNQHLTGVGDHWQLLWTVLMYRHWASCWASELGRRPEGESTASAVAPSQPEIAVHAA